MTGRETRANRKVSMVEGDRSVYQSLLDLPRTPPVSCDRPSDMPAVGRFLLVPALLFRTLREMLDARSRWRIDVWIHVMIESCEKDDSAS